MELETTFLGSRKNAATDHKKPPKGSLRGNPKKFTTDWSKTSSERVLVISLLLFLGFFVFSCSQLITGVIESFVSQRPEFNLESMVLSFDDISTSEIRAQWELTLSIKNPKLGVDMVYNAPTVKIFYGNGNEALQSETNMESFHQKPGQKSLITLKLSTNPVHVSADAAQAIEAQRTWQRGVVFKIEIHDEVTVNPGLPSERRIEITVSCKYVMLEFLADGMIGKTSDTQHCSFD